MLVIGETFNFIIPKVGQLVVAHDHVDCGSQMLDVNTGGLAGWDELCIACLQASRIRKLGII